MNKELIFSVLLSLALFALWIVALNNTPQSGIPNLILHDNQLYEDWRDNLSGGYGGSGFDIDE